jgi:hypothetical protein
MTMKRSAAILGACLITAACGADHPKAAEVQAVASKEQALARHRTSLARDLSRDPANLKPVQLARGIRAVRIESGFRHVTMLALDRAGGAHQGCADELSSEGVR